MTDDTKKLPRINCSFKTFNNCQEDYVTYGMRISDISRRHNVKKPTLEKWRKDYGWDDQRELYLFINGVRLRVLAKVGKMALKENTDHKYIQLFKDLDRQFINNDPNMAPIPNKERLIIVQMVFDFMNKKHAKTVDRFLREKECEALFEAVVAY